MARGRKTAKKKLPDIRRDAGTDATQAKRAAYGTDGSDSLGRAYRSGLLGNDGQRLLQTGRSIHRAYWSMFGSNGITCTLGTKNGGGNHDGNIEREKWLTHTMREIDRMGRAHRKAFDDLVLDFHPDYGPDWMDRIIAKRHDAPVADWSQLAKALDVLDQLSD